jgi:hypothetical protein
MIRFRRRGGVLMNKKVGVEEYVATRLATQGMRAGAQ